MFYDHFFAKASACVEVYQKLTSSRGNPSLTLDELLAAVARALTGQKCFSSVASIKDFILSQGEFIFKQLIGLDETSKKSDEKFIELPVLAALRNESYKHEDLTHAQPRSSTGTLKIGPELSDTGNKMMQSGSSNCPEEHDEDLKLARLLNEEEYWHLLKQKKNKASISSSTKFYIKINEDEIVDDYPLPAYYKTSNQETDEYVIFDSGIYKCHIDDLPRSMLHNWALYNADLRLISLELLPMKPCADIDVTVFGSGVMTADDGSGYNFDTDNYYTKRPEAIQIYSRTLQLKCGTKSIKVLIVYRLRSSATRIIKEAPISPKPSTASLSQSHSMEPPDLDRPLCLSLLTQRKAQRLDYHKDNHSRSHTEKKREITKRTNAQEGSRVSQKEEK